MLLSSSSSSNGQTQTQASEELGSEGVKDEHLEVLTAAANEADK